MSFRDIAPRSGLPPGLEYEDDAGGLSPPQARPRHGAPCRRARSDATTPRPPPSCASASAGADAAPHVQQREEEYALRVLREREAELREVHRKMHAVDAIYRDLGEVVAGQQGQVERVAEECGRATENARRGAERIARANAGRGRRGGEAAAAAEAGPGADGKPRFFLLRYLARSAAGLARAVSACTGGAAYGRPD